MQIAQDPVARRCTHHPILAPTWPATRAASKLQPPPSQGQKALSKPASLDFRSGTNTRGNPLCHGVDAANWPVKKKLNIFYRYHPCNGCFHPSLLHCQGNVGWGRRSSILASLLSSHARWSRSQATPWSRNWNPVFFTPRLALNPCHCLPGYFQAISLIFISCIYTLPFNTRQHSHSS